VAHQLCAKAEQQLLDSHVLKQQSQTIPLFNTGTSNTE
jgi:hypothetical protein